MEYDVDFNSYDALCSLVYNANEDVLEILRGKIIDVNTYNSTGSSVLKLAVCFGHLKKMKVLLEHGADPNAVDDRTIHGDYMDIYIVSPLDQLGRI